MRAATGVLAAALVALVVVLGATYLRAPRATHVGRGAPVPELALPSLVGGGLDRLSSHKGAPVFLFFFDNTWPATTKYAPLVERLYRKYYRRGLHVIGVCLDDDLPRARTFALEQALTFTILSDPGGVRSRPAWGEHKEIEAYLIDPAGRVQAGWTEPVDWRRPEVAAEIERHLSPPPPGWPDAAR